MNWLVFIWSVPATACVTLGVMHLVIWFKRRVASAHLAFACAAFAAAGIAVCEGMLMEAGTAADFAQVIRWIHLPIMMLVASIVCFVAFYFRTGRAWLGWAAVGVRFVSLVLNFVFPVNLNYREITELRRVDFFGSPVTMVAKGVANPLNYVAHLSSVLLLLFVVDASLRLLRKGERDDRRRAVVVGGSVVAFLVLATGHTFLIHAGIIKSPYLISLFFLCIIAAMGYELIHDVVSAAGLAEELRESHSQMNMAADAAKLALWVWDIPKNMIWMSPKALRMYGASPEETITLEQVLERVHPEDRTPVQNAIEQSLSGDEVYVADYRVMLPGGVTKWISARGKVEFDGAGKPRRMSGMSLDYTERKDAEDLSRLVVDAAPNAIIMVDAAGRMVLVNKEAESMFGYSRQELLGEHFDLLIPDRFKASYAAIRRKDAAHPDSRMRGAARELCGLRKGGSEVPLEVALNPVQTCEGSFVMASITDLTERRRMEREVALQQNELTHLSGVSSLAQLSGSLAHELNQPLGIILSNSQAAQRILEGESPDLAEVRDILADIVSEDRRAGEVIKRLRALLKRGETRLLPVSANDVIEDVLRLTHSDFISRGVGIRTMFAADLPQIMGDAVQLQQVMLNLIINACDAMAEVALSERIVGISTRRRGETVRISIADQGCGLPGRDAARVFQPFFTTKPQGMGIGLSICRSIITAHRGSLWAEPNDGSGTTFHLELHTCEAAVCV